MPMYEEGQRPDTRIRDEGNVEARGKREEEVPTEDLAYARANLNLNEALLRSRSWSYMPNDCFLVSDIGGDR